MANSEVNTLKDYSKAVWRDLPNLSAVETLACHLLWLGALASEMALFTATARCQTSPCNRENGKTYLRQAPPGAAPPSPSPPPPKPSPEPKSPPAPNSLPPPLPSPKEALPFVVPLVAAPPPQSSEKALSPALAFQSPPSAATGISCQPKSRSDGEIAGARHGSETRCSEPWLDVVNLPSPPFQDMTMRLSGSFDASQKLC